MKPSEIIRSRAIALCQHIGVSAAGAQGPLMLTATLLCYLDELHGKGVLPLPENPSSENMEEWFPGCGLPKGVE